MTPQQFRTKLIELLSSLEGLDNKTTKFKKIFTQYTLTLLDFAEQFPLEAKACL